MDAQTNGLNVFLNRKVKVAFNDGKQIVTKYGVVKSLSDGLLLLEYRDGKREALNLAGIVRLEEWWG